MYSIFDVMYIFQIAVTFTLVRLMLASDYDEEMFEVNANWIRYIGVFGTLCLFFKFSYFLSLID